MDDRKKNRTVIVVIHAPQWGGLHALVERIDPYLRAAGWHTIVVLPRAGDNGAGRFRASGIDVVEIALGRLRRSANPLTQIRFLASIVPDVMRLRRVFRENRADVIQICGLLHFHSAIAARMLRIPVVWQLHSDLAPPMLRRLFMPLVLRFANVVMTSGRGLEKSHPGATHFGERLVPFYAPVDSAIFRPDEYSRRALRNRLELSEDHVVIGTVGNRGRQKNHEMFVRVADRLIWMYGDRLRFLVCGSDVPSNRTYYEREVVALAAQLGLTAKNRLRFIAPAGEVAAYYNAMDVFLLTSHAEGASLVTMEAMATALPVVVTDVGSLRDSVADGLSGFVIPPNDDLGMSAAIAKLIDLPEVREAIGLAALNRAREFFTTEHCALAHIRAYVLAMGDETRRFT